MAIGPKPLKNKGLPMQAKGGKVTERRRRCQPTRPVDNSGASLIAVIDSGA
jgi:hypothetical protein